jgi:peptidoglycan/xylan/chitin deacetylase (PgdA/CDA1 family)
MKTLWWLPAISILTVSISSAAAPGDALGPVSMDSYSQTILVTFKSEAAARQARLHIAPLYHDLRAAFSTRMDDCNLNDLRVAEVMAKFGQRGTFTLNDPKSWWQDSTETGVKVSGDPAVEIPRRLLSGGNSIGGHTLNHEMLPALSKNAAFREILGARVALELWSATPNISFVYPFVFFRSGLRSGTDRADLEEMLRRSGYYQLAEHRYNEDWDSGLQDGLFITCDADSIGGTYSESVLTQARSEEDRPLFLVTMHAWVKQWGGPEFPKLAEIYRRWSGRADWWYCNQNQYAAYRYQALHSRLATFVEGNVLTAVLTRPDPLDLGDWTPLTLRMDGMSEADVVSVESPGADVKPVAPGGAYAFDLSHGHDHGTIEAYAESGNPGNTDRLDQAKSSTEGLRALLYRKDRVLTLALRNESGQALHDIRAVFRLALRWQEGVVRKQVGTLAGGASVTLDVPLSERADAELYSDGPDYEAAQVDYRGQRRGRLYATCEVAGGEPSAFFARNGFRLLGPLPGDLAGFDPLTFARPFLEGQPPARDYSAPWGGNLVWKTLEPSKASILDPDIIPTTGKANTPESSTWDPSVYFPHGKVHFVLYGRIVSAEDQTVRAVFDRRCIKRLSLNARMVEGDELVLKKGANDVRILYAPAPGVGSSYTESNYGCYFRLTDASGRRVEKVSFELPPTP